MRVPASIVALPLIVGSTIGLAADLRQPLALTAATGAVLAWMAGLAWRDEERRGPFLACVLAGTFAAGLSLGASAAREAYEPPLLRWFDARAAGHERHAVLEGTLLEDAAAGPFGVSLALAVTRAAVEGESIDRAPPRPGGVRLGVAGTLAREMLGEWRAGRTVRGTAYLRRPGVYRNPGVPDGSRALARRGFVLVGSVKSGALVECVARGSPVAEAAGAVRAWVRQTIARHVGSWSARSRGVATAILLGDRTGLDQDDERRLQEAGTYHVIAISGGNIAILTVILLGTFSLLRLPPRAAAAAAIVLLLFYGTLTAPASSVDRAVTAAVVYLCGRLLDQTGPAMNVLAVAAALAIAWTPAAAFDPGFLLSFGATLAILVGVPRLLQRLPGGACRPASALLAATIAAEVALMPIAASVFSRVTFAGILLNFAAIPLMTAVQAGSMLTLALAPVSGALASRCGYLVHLSAAALVDSARLVEFVPWIAREVPPPSWPIVAVYYAAVLAAIGVRRVARAAWTVAACAGAVIVFGGAATSRDGVPAPAEGTLRVVFLDVGQGDATALVLPGGRAWLVDAGGFPIPSLRNGDEAQGPRFDIGERVVAPALRALGVRRLDTLVVTHGDPDHLGGAPAIVRLFRPRAVWEGVPVPPHAPLAALAAGADEAGAAWRRVLAGEELRFGAVQIRVLHPPRPEWERQRVRNEDSVVLQVRIGAVSIVLPGDIGREAEPLALAHFVPTPIVILKAPHHGSASSSTKAFLDALRPSAVIFSAGRDNLFGHPAPSVVSRYRAIGAARFSTAEDGAIVLDTDGQSVEIRGWTKRRYTIRAPPSR